MVISIRKAVLLIIIFSCFAAHLYSCPEIKRIIANPNPAAIGSMVKITADIFWGDYEKKVIEWTIKDPNGKVVINQRNY